LFARKLGEPPAVTWVCELLDSVFAQLESACVEGRSRRPRRLDKRRLSLPRFGGSPICGAAGRTKRRIVAWRRAAGQASHDQNSEK
jgi:hypothetical protein